MLSRVGAVIVATLASLPTMANATPWEPSTKAARAKMDEGATAFKAADYPTAAAAFSAAWDAEHALKARWNAAQSFAAGGDWAHARSLFQELLADSTLPKAYRNEATARLKVAVAFTTAAELAAAGRWTEARDAYERIHGDAGVGDRDHAQASEAAKALTEKLVRDAAERKAREEATPQRAAAPPAHEVADPPASHAQPTREPRRDWIGWSVVGSGVVVGAVGVGFTFHASSLYDQADEQPNQRANLDLRDRADTQRIGGAIAVGVGAALVVGGAIKLMFGPSRNTPAVAVAPLTGGGFLAVGANF